MLLFAGEYEHSIDDKQRLAVPSEIRTRLEQEGYGSAFYLVTGPNGALWMWPERTFEEMAGAMDQSLLPDQELMEFEELFFSQAARLELDKNGRVRIPERLLQHHGIEQGVMILGVKDHLELRGRREWEERRKDKLAKQGEIMLRARQALADQRRRQGASSPPADRSSGRAARGDDS